LILPIASLVCPFKVDWSCVDMWRISHIHTLASEHPMVCALTNLFACGVRLSSMASKGITGKLTVLQGTKKSEADIKEGGDNTLRVMGVNLGKGDKLVAALTNVNGKSMTVRFTIK